jgi:chromosome segregation ATPase
LDQDQIFSQFGAIENKIQKLIEICGSQQTVILELQHKIKQLEEELRIQNEAVKRHVEDRALIRSRVDNLLAKLEDATRT